MRALYPGLKPYQTHHLPVTRLHTLYLEECGNPSGIPVLILPDQPGSGCQPYQRQLFDPARYRMILLDPRGCGHSTPHGELQDNHTQALLTDLAWIHEQFQVTQWLVYGNFWGSTLALLYAEAHPTHLLGVILCNVFLAQLDDIAWLIEDGANRFYPEQWEHFRRGVPLHDRHQHLKGYYQQLTGENHIQQMQASKQWNNWLATLLGQTLSSEENNSTGLAQARIQAHYFTQQCFLRDQQILQNINRLEELPGIILHGRFNVPTPVYNAWKLKRQWADCVIKILPSDRHNLQTPEYLDAVINAGEFFAEQYGGLP